MVLQADTRLGTEVGLQIYKEITQKKERVMSKCKEDKCANEVDTFYYCDDHFKGEGESNE